MTGLHDQLVDALHADGHSLRFGPDGYELSRALIVVQAAIDAAVAQTLEEAADWLGTDAPDESSSGETWSDDGVTALAWVQQSLRDRARAAARNGGAR